MPPSAIDQNQSDRPIVSADELRQMTEDCLVGMLQLPFDARSPETPMDPSDLLHASIEIRGAASREFRVICSKSLAQRIAQAMFCAEIDALSAQDVRDALAEVANVIGGNVKSAMNEECQLGLPKVEEESDANQTCSCRQTFECDGRPITIELSEARSIES